MLKVFPPLPHYFLGIKRPPRNPTYVDLQNVFQAGKSYSNRMNLLARDSLIYFAFIFSEWPGHTRTGKMTPLQLDSVYACQRYNISTRLYSTLSLNLNRVSLYLQLPLRP
jgi:hypothetical protein